MILYNNYQFYYNFCLQQNNTFKMSSRGHSTAQNEQAILNSIKMFFPDLEIEMHTLKNPTSAFFLSFCDCFLTELGGNTNTMAQIQLNQMTLISHVDMYSQTVPCLNMYKSMNYFFRNIGVNDFSLSDLLNPTPKRTLSLIRELMNFLEYCDATVSELYPELEKASALQSKQNDLKAKIEMLKIEINDRASKRVTRGEMMKELDKNIEKEKDKMNELFNEKEIQKEAMEDIKKVILQLEEKEAQYARIIKDLNEEIESLNSKIVKSPEKLKQDLQQLQDKKQNHVETMKSLKIQIEEKKKLTSILNKEQKEQENRCEKLKEILELAESNKMLKQSVDTFRIQYMNKIEDIEEAKQNILSQTKRCETLKEVLEELNSRKVKQDMDMKEALSAAEKEHASLVRKKEEQQQHDDQIQLQINELHDKEKTLEQEFDQFFEEFKKNKNKLEIQEQKIREYYDNALVSFKENVDNIEGGKK